MGYFPNVNQILIQDLCFFFKIQVILMKPAPQNGTHWP